MASRRRDYGSFSARLQDLSAKTNRVEPYPVTDTVTITPPSKGRREKWNDAYTRLTAAQAKLEALVKGIGPEPQAPELAELEPLPDGAAGELVAERAAIEAGRAELVDKFEADLAKWTAKVESFEQMSEDIATEAQTAGEQYSRALFGEVYDDIMAMSEDWDAELWDAFVADVNDHFSSGVKPPPDGTCPACGQVVDTAEAVEAGKLPT